MDDEDATLLNMTKTRLSLLRMQDSSLKKLLLKSIAKKYRFYAHNDIKEKNLEKLPNTLRNKVLEEFSHHLKSEDVLFSEEEFSLRLAMFRRLINSQTLKVDLTGCLLYCNPMTYLKESLVEMLLDVLEKAPNLEELTLGECSNILSLHITMQWLSKLSQLRKLKSLKISSPLCLNDIDHLLNVCQHMPNLQVIWVRVSKIKEGNELNLLNLKRCFPSLIVHSIKGDAQINKMKFKNLETLLDELCCRNAQELKKVYHSESKVFSYEIQNMGINDPPTRRTIYTGSPGNFRRVSIEMMNETVPRHGYKLYRSYYQDDWEETPDRKVPVEEIKDGQEASRFNCIRFVDCGRSFFQAFQIHQPFCWPNVHTFTIENLSFWRPAELQLEISLIAERFPNLERLILKDACIVNRPALNVMNLSSLRELQLDEPDYELELQPTPLSTIFSVAPNLEIARVNGTVSDFFTVEDLKVVTSMIANETILRKLQKLQIAIRALPLADYLGETLPNNYIPEKNIQQVIKLLKTASAFLPRLREIKLTTMDSWGKKIRFSRRKRNSEGIFWPTVTDSIFERHRFSDFLGAFQ